MTGKIICNLISVLLIGILIIFPFDTAFSEIECILLAILFAIYALNFKN